MNKYHKVMEYFWLVIGIITSIFAYNTYNSGQQEDMGFIMFMPIIAFVLFGLRRFHRLKLEKFDRENKKND